MTIECGVLQVETNCAREMLAHVQEALPNEGVGLLAGPKAGQVTMVVPLHSSGGPMHFFVEPYVQYLGEKRIKDRNLQLLAIYHSHPGGCANLSDLDLCFAKNWDCLQVVIANAGPEGHPVGIRAFRVFSGMAIPIGFQVIPNLRLRD